MTKAVEKHGENWKKVAETLGNRTENQCSNRWYKYLNPALVKGQWTVEEDQKMIELVQQYGAKKWSFIASQLKGRVGKQCRERYDRFHLFFFSLWVQSFLIFPESDL